MKSLLKSKTKAVAANIRKMREYRNYTQQYLASRLDISQNAYSKIELGYYNITIDRLANISEVLEVSFINLLNMETDQLSLLKAAGNSYDNIDL